MNDKLKDIMSAKYKLINEIDKNGFDILEKYKVYDCKFENGLIKEISFELKNNPLDTSWDWNGCIILVFEYKDDKIKCHIRVEAVTDVINYSDFYEYERYYDRDFEDRQKDMPKFKNEEEFLDFDTYCNFSSNYNIKFYKTINIFKKITENVIASNNNIEECIDTQNKINEFEQEYYELALEFGLEEEYGKSIDEISDEEIEEYKDRLDGISTYNMMVAEGWIDED